MLHRVTKQVTNADVEAISTNHIMNFAYSSQHPKFLELFRKFNKKFSLALPGYNPGVFGKPNVHMRGYESYPGVWIFESDTFQVKWVIFSDCHRKHSWKGTSFEIACDKNITDTMLCGAFCELCDLLGFEI